MRNIAPNMNWACRQVISASMKNRLTRQRNTLGRITSRRFTLTASSSATGRAPWVSSLPAVDGIGMSSDWPLQVFG